MTLYFVMRMKEPPLVQAVYERSISETDDSILFSEMHDVSVLLRVCKAQRFCFHMGIAARPRTFTVKKRCLHED